MKTFLYQPTNRFLEKLAKVKNQHPVGYERIMKVVERLLETPDDADGQLHGLHRGTFKKYVGRSEYRIIYYYCELCRKANKRLVETCEHCASIPDHSVVFFDLFHKNESEKLGY